jgi:hypothetical protein
MVDDEPPVLFWNRWWHAYKHGHDSQSFDDDGRVVKLRPSPRRVKGKPRTEQNFDFLFS